MNTLKRVGVFGFIGATAADISPDGMQVIIRRYSTPGNAFLNAATAATYWRRPDAAISLVDLLKQPGTIVPLVDEFQGEAIAFSKDGRGFYTTGERSHEAGTLASPVTFYAPAH